MGSDFEAALDDLAAGPAPSSVEDVGAVQDETTLPPHPSIDAARAQFGDAILRHELHAGDEHVMFVQPGRVREVLRWLKDDPAHHYDYLADVTAVDYGGGRPLQVLYQLWSIDNKRQLRVKAELPLDALEIDSVAPLWLTADWLEREVYDMFGIQFNGHPDMRRILMPENYEEGHPLRKDFPLRGRFSRAEQTRRSLAMDVEDFYIPQELEFMEEAGQPVEDPLGNAGQPGPGMSGISGG